MWTNPPHSFIIFHGERVIIMINHNEIAHKNGKSIELLVLERLRKQKKKVTLINGIFDLILENNRYIEIKSCQLRIEDTTQKYGVRNGRFTINNEQHKALIEATGIYLFVLHKDRKIIKMKFVLPSNIKFKKQIVWTKIFSQKQ